MKHISILVGMAALAAASPLAAQAPARAPAPAAAANMFAPGTHAVKIQANDFKKTTDFYTALGMKVGADRGADGSATREIIWDGATYNSGLLLVTPTYAQNAKMMRGGTVLMLTLPNLDVVATRLRAAGFADIGTPHALGDQVTILMLTDPDGNKVELMGPPPKK